MPYDLKAVEMFVTGKKYRNVYKNALTKAEKDLVSEHLVEKRR